MPPSRPVAQKSHASAQPTCELRQTVYLAVGSASSDAACPARRRSFSARAASGSGSGMRTASISRPSGQLEEILQETVLGAAPLEDFEVGPGARRVQRRGRRVGQAAHGAGREPDGAVAVDAGEDPRRDVGAHAERRDRGDELVAIQVAQVQRF